MHPRAPVLLPFNACSVVLLLFNAKASSAAVLAFTEFSISRPNPAKIPAKYRICAEVPLC